MSTEGNREVQVFEANLRMTKIADAGVRFRVEDAAGYPVEGFSHIQIARKAFPRDDDFSMDFINLDLDAIAPTDPNMTVDKKGLQRLKEKQAKFRQFAMLRMAIFQPVVEEPEVSGQRSEVSGGSDGSDRGDQPDPKAALGQPDFVDFERGAGESPDLGFAGDTRPEIRGQRSEVSGGSDGEPDPLKE